MREKELFFCPMRGVCVRTSNAPNMILCFCANIDREQNLNQLHII